MTALSPRVYQVVQALEVVSAAEDVGQLLRAVEELETAVHRLRAAVNSAVMLGKSL